MITVTGFLGAGKSTLVASLADAGIEAVEHPALSTPPPGARTIAVADAANVVTCLEDPLYGDLVRAQIAAARLIAVTRGDVLDARPAVEAVGALTDAPIVEAPMGRLDLDSLSDTFQPAPRPALDLTARFADWHYDGPAKLREKALTRFLEARPEGLYRLKGHVLTDKGRVQIEIAGQVRQTRTSETEGPTALTATGPRDQFRPDEMALSFAEAASQSAFLAGIFGHR